MFQSVYMYFIFYGVTTQILYSNAAINFYVYTATGREFRKQFILLFSAIKPRGPGVRPLTESRIRGASGTLTVSEI